MTDRWADTWTLPLVGCAIWCSFAAIFCTAKKNKKKWSVILPPPFLAADDRTVQTKKKKHSHSAASVLLGWAAARDKDLISSMTWRANMLLRLALPEAWEEWPLPPPGIFNSALCPKFSGGGNGSTTVVEVTGHLLMRKASIGPLMLFR